MNIKYKLNKDIVARIAANLCWNLEQLKSTVRITNQDRFVNGKSLIGILTARMRYGDIITISFDESTDLDNIKNIFNELGGEI